MIKTIAAIFPFLLGIWPLVVAADEASVSEILSLEEVKAAGALRSDYRKQVPQIFSHEAPKANLEAFRKEIGPLLQNACVQCHGPDKQKADFRVDTLDPDLIQGDDANWWLEVVDVLSNAEMPPDDEDVELADADRTKIIDWLSAEIQIASQVRRSEEGHSSFRRMTRYEYNYALQDLLGLSFDLAKDLPPETVSEDGFQNSSEMLQMTASQFQQYRDIGRVALQKATVRGEQPKPIYFSITADELAARAMENYENEKKQNEARFKDDPEKLAKAMEKLAEQKSQNANLSNPHVISAKMGALAPPKSGYGGKQIRWDPVEEKPAAPETSGTVLVIPPRKLHLFDFGDFLPDSGTMRVRFRASRGANDGDSFPSLRIRFGYQPSNNSQTSFTVTTEDIAIQASPDDPQFYECEIHLGEISRNAYRGVTKLGVRPNPSEYLVFENVNQISRGTEGDQLHLDYIEVTTPFFEEWPPQSHTQIFSNHHSVEEEAARAREVLTSFMTRAWRRPVTDDELDRKLALFSTIRPACTDFQEAIIEVLAGVISSPQFLYLTQTNGENELTDYELATRLSMFLWCSVPDGELLDLAESGKLNDEKILVQQTHRMLADPRAKRFSEQFTRQWLGMQLLDFLNVDKKVYPGFNADLKAAMQQEPIALFHELLATNGSVMDFLHADYALLNERLAQHYGMKDVHGNQFQKVSLAPESRRGGLLTQAGLLAMNSDGKDSHPLKRGIWLLENLLHDPPPPPPPVVPEIDLTDPDILKLTLKERMEDHRNDPACMSCHAKIDPWGIAFENFDAIGSWRDRIGKEPVDASALLFNNQQLNGIDGLKRYLLEHRQDQFARAFVYKLSSYALGRPMSFADRADLEQITGDFRQQDDKLATLITLLITSDLFLSK